MPVTVDVEERLTPDLRETWISLLPSAHWGFFSHPDWCQAVWNHFGPTRDLRILVAREGGRAVGVLPVWSHRMNKYGLYLPVTDLFGSRRGDYGAPVIHPEADVESVLAAFLDAVPRLGRTGGTVVWPHLPDSRGAAGALAGILDARGYSYRRETSICHIVDLEGSYDDIAAGWDRKKRQNVNRYRRKMLERFDSLEIVTFDTPDEALERLPAFFEMHDHRWVEAGHPGTFDEPGMREFFEELVQRFAGSHLHFSALMAGDRAAAYRVGFVYGGYFLAFRSAFDWTLRRLSPGQVMNAETIRYGVDQGWKGIDLLGGDYDYKDSLSSRTQDRVTYIVRTGRVAPAYWWITRGRPALERRVGAVVYRVRARWGRLTRALTSPASPDGDDA